MKCAIRRKGFSPQVVRQIAAANENAVWAVICLANDSCAIGDESFATLKNYLTRTFRKYAAVYGAYVDFGTGEVILRASINKRYRNHLSDEITELTLRQTILEHLKRRLWCYLDEIKAELWIEGLEEELEAVALAQTRAERARQRSAAERKEWARRHARQVRALKRLGSI